MSATLLKRCMYLLTLYYVIKVVYTAIDTKIDGKWREQPLLNLLNHPHMDYHRTFEEICQEAGYNVESHYVTTEDGYINQMFRINDGVSSANARNRPAAMLVHGLIDASDTFILNGNSSIAFMLVEFGYDVWVVNTRGNRYSLGHVRYDSAVDKEYWDEGHSNMIAKYDVPAFIEHIRQES